MTEETARGAMGRYKDGDKIRFRQMLPEKLGGWILATIGLEDEDDSDVQHETSQFTGLGATYIVGASVITLEAAFTVDDGDTIWLLGRT